LYRPRTTGKTMILWVAPFLLVLFGGFAMFRVVRHRMSLPMDDDRTSEGSPE
jgi:cytochrome c-type biogenesis protein CcmH/NrfF